ncbi:glutathione S-transferase family protein [Roseibium sp. SCP14]|uniref:glutathione S-transferase family protein n=1 Tax=Roseibium sp. SCP14 TaxID=3141375 RepID=UPI00333DC584
MTAPLTLISHSLCPYVQRAAIVLAEKKVPFERINIDLAHKPDWFRAASPLGKVPLLKIGNDRYLFESAPIVEFLDETEPSRLHPEDPAERAWHRAYVEFASQCLNGIGALYAAGNEPDFQQALITLRQKFEHLDNQISRKGPFFSGERFSLVDAAFGPVFRYFDVFETFTRLETFRDLEHVSSWRRQLADRASVRNAVSENYGELLLEFLGNRGSWISGLLRDWRQQMS